MRHCVGLSTTMLRIFVSDHKRLRLSQFCMGDLISVVENRHCEFVLNGGVGVYDMYEGQYNY